MYACLYYSTYCTVWYCFRHIRDEAVWPQCRSCPVQLWHSIVSRLSSVDSQSASGFGTSSVQRAARWKPGQANAAYRLIFHQQIWESDREDHHMLYSHIWPLMNMWYTHDIYGLLRGWWDRNKFFCIVDDIYWWFGGKYLVACYCIFVILPWVSECHTCHQTQYRSFWKERPCLTICLHHNSVTNFLSKMPCTVIYFVAVLIKSWLYCYWCCAVHEWLGCRWLAETSIYLIVVFFVSVDFCCVAVFWSFLGFLRICVDNYRPD